MIEVAMQDGRVFDVEYEYAFSSEWTDRHLSEIVICDVWDAEGNQLNDEDFSEVEQAEIKGVCFQYAMNSDNFPLLEKRGAKE